MSVENCHKHATQRLTLAGPHQ